jgi:hypothetical protein
MSDGWVLVFVVSFLIGIVLLLSYGGHVADASFLEHKRVAEIWDEYEDMRQLIAEKLEDGKLSNGDYSEIISKVTTLHIHEYNNKLTKNSFEFLELPEPMIVNDPDPFILNEAMRNE